jgi:glycosyltransferase involved in cell wall biosynthesis
MIRNLMLVTSSVSAGLIDEIANDKYPRTDFFELSKSLNADIVSYQDVSDAKSGLTSIVNKLLGRSAALALEGFRRRADFDMVFTTSEAVGIPLALLFKFTGTRKRHVMVTHRLTPPKKAFVWKTFGLEHQTSILFVYSAAQRKIAIENLGTNPDKVVQIPFMADQKFFRPMQDIAEKNQICSVGLEWRDYPTLIEAANGLECDVKIAAGSLWSKGKNEAEGRNVPPNVDVRMYKYPDLRRLYAESKIVVIPLYETDFQAGITSILEAMAMGKPVIVTRTTGQTDTVTDGKTGIYVNPGDAADLRAKIQYLLSSDAERRRIGEAGRAAFLSQFTLDLLVKRICSVTGQPHAWKP